MRARALELGLTELGFTSADPLPHEEFFERWIADGKHGEMDYLRRGAPARPESLLPGARTLVVASARYPRAATEPAPLAAYATRGDYHPGLRRALQPLAAELRAARPGSTTKLAIDTAPILEREAAMRAGIGWIGKNTLVVHPQHGCYTLLGIILWTAPIEPDLPGSDRCGSCRRCLDACPTAAFAGPYQLDPRRCISYLTIEQEGPIPLELRSAMGTRAFGCDACIAACPFGSRSPFEESALLPTSAELAGATLADLLERAGGHFWKTFRWTPIERARRRGFLRNLLVAAGNAHDPGLVEHVRPFTTDDDALIAEHARWALERLQ